MKLKQIRVDGYKNLINCKLDLGDFNVLVGPNNSGKSNFLETFQTLMVPVWGEGVDAYLRRTPAARWAGIFTNLAGHKKKGVSIAIGFETEMKRQMWACEYTASIGRQGKPGKLEEGNMVIQNEALEGKPPGRPGPQTVFWKRDGTTISVATKKGAKKHRIGETKAGHEFLRSTYPKLTDLEDACFVATVDLILTCMAYVLTLNPHKLRESLGSEDALFPVMRRTHFDMLLHIDQIYASSDLSGLFEATLCDTLELEAVHFTGQDVYAKGKKAGKNEFVKRLRSFAIKKKGGSFGSIENYSDGTLVVAAILAALLSREPESPLLCIEEPENYLHPRALEKLLRFLQDNAHRWPVLITTHSPYLLNGVNPKDVTVSVVDKTGAAHFEKIKSSRELRDYLNKGLMSFGDLLVSDFEGFREG